MEARVESLLDHARLLVADTLSLHSIVSVAWCILESSWYPVLTMISPFYKVPQLYMLDCLAGHVYY